MDTVPGTGRPRTIDATAARVVARCAPDEVPAFPRVRDEFFARGGTPARAGDDPLGFGAVAVGVVAGIVLAVLNELVVGSLTDILRPWWDRAWRSAVRRLRGPRSATPATELPALPPAQVPAVTEAVTRHAIRSGLPPAQAVELARALVAELTADRPDAVPEHGAGDDD